MLLLMTRVCVFLCWFDAVLFFALCSVFMPFLESYLVLVLFLELCLAVLTLWGAQGALGERRFAEAREALEVARGHYAEVCSAISLRPIPLPPYAQLRYQPTPNSATTLRAAPISIHPTPLPPYAQLCYQSSPDSAITLHYTPRSLYRQLCYNPTCSSALTLRPTPL